ncbi:MAG: hypothetical protein J6Y01_05140, partial [Spirochaetales bacterium]|nr:hypothetical protein [Spirochaetales bacterium]
MRFINIIVIIIVAIILICCSNRNMRDETDAVYIYDNDGRHVRLRLDEARGEDLLIHQFNETGHIIKVILKDNSGDHLNVQEFDGDGALLKEESYQGGKRVGYTTFDHEGLKTSENYILDENRYVSFVYEYYHDQSSDDPDKQQPKRSSITKYDGQEQVYRQTNNISDSDIQNGDNQQIHIATADRIQKYEYGGKVVRETMTDKSGNLIYEYEKNAASGICRYTQYEKGHPVSVIEYNLNDAILNETKLKDGKIISSNQSDFDGNIIREAEYKNG